MELGLRGKKIAVLVELPAAGEESEAPLRELSGSGAELHRLIASPADVEVHANGEASGAGMVRPLASARADDYVATVVPACNEDGALASDGRALAFIQGMMESDRPVAAFGSGVRLLSAADALRGRTVAAPAELRAGIEAAGGTWTEQAVQVDQKLLTARACDVPGLGRKLAREFANALDSTRVDMLSESSFPASDPPPGPSAP